MLRKVLFAASVLSVSCCLAVVAGQATEEEAAKNAGKNKVQPGEKETGDAAAAHKDHAHHHGQWKNSDHCFASCVALGNQAEVILGQVAAKKSQNDDVKKFAEMLVTDHKMYLTKLKKFAPECTMSGCLESNKAEAKAGEREALKPVTSTEDAEDATAEKATAKRADAKSDDEEKTSKSDVEDKNAKTDRDEKTAKSGQAEKSNRADHADSAHPHHGAEMAKVELELAQQCLMSSKEALEEKSGAEFDKCFIGMQIAKHMGMRDKLIVYQRHASRELAEVFAAGQKKTEEHLAKAKEIMASLEHAPVSAK